jgi:DNA polymerase-3 subunit delta'
LGEIRLVSSDIWNKVTASSSSLKILKNQLSKGKIFHTNLFTGPNGSGKVEAARALAASLNCSLSGCGVCSCCKRIWRSSYPDVIEVHPEGDYLTIDQTREVKEISFLSPYEGKIRVIIFFDVQKLTLEASNSLLKVLEEPPPKSIFILVGRKKEDVIPTIFSRANWVNFPRLSLDILVEKLVGEGVSAEKALLSFHFSDGDISLARRFSTEEFQSLRNSAVRFLISFAGEDEHSWKQFDSLKEEISKVISSLHEEYEEKKEELSGSFLGETRSKLWQLMERKIKREFKAEERNVYSFIYRVLESFLRDAIFYQSGASPSLINRGLLDELKIFSHNHSMERLLKSWERIKDYHSAIASNVNLNLLLLVSYIEMKEVFGGKNCRSSF